MRASGSIGTIYLAGVYHEVWNLHAGLHGAYELENVGSVLADNLPRRRPRLQLVPFFHPFRESTKERLRQAVVAGVGADAVHAHHLMGYSSMSIKRCVFVGGACGEFT